MKAIVCLTGLRTGTKTVGFFVLCVSLLAIRHANAASVPGNSPQAIEREQAGDLPGARAILEKATADGQPTALAAYAEFLDRHQDASRRASLLKWASVETDPTQKRLALRQAVLTDTMEGHANELVEDLAQYRAAGGTDLHVASAKAAARPYETILLPGPLSSFARMAALAPELDAEDLLPAFAHNVVTNGYVAANNETLQETEYLKLVQRYLGQARELQAMAGSEHRILIPTCDSEQTGALLKVLGYRMRGSCGGDIVLETVNPTRAFITVDSGFPLAQLERNLRTNRRFELPYAPTPVPVLYGPQYWLTASGKTGTDFLDVMLAEPGLCRLFMGLSHVDHATAEALRKQTAPAKLRLYANVLDFYGGMFEIENGVAVVPGSAKTWASFTGASPSNPGAFFEKLLTTDDGWMAAYFDSLRRMDDKKVQAYLTEPERMKRFYDALRGKITTPGPARPVFRSTTDLMLLTTSLRLDPDGTVHLPGGLGVWRSMFAKHSRGKYDSKIARVAPNWRAKDEALEALFALSHKVVDNEPLQIFLSLNNIDRGRAKPLSAEMATRLVAMHHTLGSQYALFAETPTLSEHAMNDFLDFCTSTGSIRDTMFRADAVGSAQAVVGLWSVFARQNIIPEANQDASFIKVVDAFSHVSKEQDLFAASRSSLDALLEAAGDRASGPRQDRLIDLLVGKVRPAVNENTQSPAERFLRAFDAQNLISVDHLFDIWGRLGKGPLDPKTAKLVNEQIERLRETASLHESLSSDEKNTFAGIYWTSRHATLEQKLDLEALEKNPDQKNGRTALVALLRDTLVGTLYCYYAPPGAQVLLTNPLFVRNHDFIGMEGDPAFWHETEVSSGGWPASAGGRLMGSLIALPYALAGAEQNFLTPRREQALIWGDLVPQMTINVTVPRWRNITPLQVRWVALNVERGRTLLAAASLDPEVETKVLVSLRQHLNPVDVERLQSRLNTGNFAKAISQIPPAMLYALAADPALASVSPDLTSVQMAEIAAGRHNELSDAAIARSFGTPKPTLTHSYKPDLLFLRTFPALMGYSSRILAETWESNNIYYAAIADQAGIPASELDTYVPEWNRAAIENIFAANLEDWPALIRSLHTTADTVVNGSARPRAEQQALSENIVHN